MGTDKRLRFAELRTEAQKNDTITDVMARLFDNWFQFKRIAGDAVLSSYIVINEASIVFTMTTRQPRKLKELLQVTKIVTDANIVGPEGQRAQVENTRFPFILDGKRVEVTISIISEI